MTGQKNQSCEPDEREPSVEVTAAEHKTHTILWGSRLCSCSFADMHKHFSTVLKWFQFPREDCRSTTITATFRWKAVTLTNEHLLICVGTSSSHASTCLEEEDVESIAWKNPFLRATKKMERLNFNKLYWSYNLVLWSDEGKISVLSTNSSGMLGKKYELHTWKSVVKYVDGLSVLRSCFAALVKLWGIMNSGVLKYSSFCQEVKTLNTHPISFAISISVWVSGPKETQCCDSQTGRVHSPHVGVPIIKQKNSSKRNFLCWTENILNSTCQSMWKLCINFCSFI